MSTTKGTTKPKTQLKPKVEETVANAIETSEESVIIQEENKKPTAGELVKRMVKIKPSTSCFIGGKGISESVRNAELFVSRVNQNGTVVIAYSRSLAEIDALFVDDIEVLDEMRTYHDDDIACSKASIRIFGVPERIDCIRENQKRLGIPDELVFIDEEHEGCIPTAKRAWSYPTDKEYVMVLQDDIELCDNFLKYVNMMIDAQPDAIISCFHLGITRRASVNRIPTVSPYVGVKDVSGQAIIMKSEYVQPCIEAWKDEIKGDDTNITAWANENNIRIITTLPMTVQHLGIKSVFDPSRSLGMSEFYDKNPVDAAWDNGYVTNVTNILR